MLRKFYETSLTRLWFKTSNEKRIVSSRNSKKLPNPPFRVDGVRVYKIAVLDTLAAIKNPTAVMAQRALEQIHAQTSRRIFQLGRELKVRGSRAGAVGATRRHNQQRQQQRENY